MIDNKTQSAVDSFRASLEDLITVAEKLATVCNSVEELTAICKLATVNDAQLKLIMNMVIQKK